MIPFNKPYLTGDELYYIKDAVSRGKISGNGYYTQKCHEFFKKQMGFRNCLLTSSCTDALEMAAILLDIKPGDEIIVPSFTFVSSANAFVLRGAHIVFADSYTNNPNLDADSLASLVTPRTRAIVVVHYAGIACDMTPIMELAVAHQIVVIEDAAQAIDSYYNKQLLGTIGHLATFSFHETKNIISGEGGMLVINDEKFDQRAEIIWEKGTNRSAFFRGEVDKYSWVDIGSSFLPSEVTAAFLYAQLENLAKIQSRRKQLWSNYFENLQPIAKHRNLSLPFVPSYASVNGHLFYLVCDATAQRTRLIEYLKKYDIHCVFHYLSLHQSPFYRNNYPQVVLPNSDAFSDNLLRLPMYYELDREAQSEIIAGIYRFFKNESIPEFQTSSSAL